jgi:hypothetical protein
MDWCVKPYEDANHHPVAIVNGSRGTEIIQIRAKPGKVIKLDAGKSYDPDGRKLIPEWLYYREAGTCSREISLADRSFIEDQLCCSLKLRSRKPLIYCLF